MVKIWIPVEKRPPDWMWTDRIEFLGKVPRERVEDLYQVSDVFVFPSFREPMGGVLFEAMRWGLPIIAAARGGPDFIVDDEAGFRIPVNEPDQFAKEISIAVTTLATDIRLRQRLSEGSQRRLKSFGTWKEKASYLDFLYRQLVDARLIGLGSNE